MQAPTWMWNHGPNVTATGDPKRLKPHGKYQLPVTLPTLNLKKNTIHWQII